MNPTKVLTRDEVRSVLADLRRKHRYPANRLNNTIFRLSTCCGLRVSEIVGLNLDDVRVDNGRPHISVRAEIAKRHKARTVPLWLDSGTLSDLIAWKAERSTMPGEAFVCSVRAADRGQRLSVRRGQRKFKQAIRCLGSERVDGLSIHAGRHTFCSLALDSGRSLVQVRDWAGHSNISTTNIYLHSADDGEIGNDFA